MSETQRTGSGASGRRDGDRASQGSAVLTPPTGLPAVPTQRAIPEVERTIAPPTPRAPVGTAICVCGHDREMHEHYRDGDDCGFCGPSACGSFRNGDEPVNPVRRALRRWRR